MKRIHLSLIGIAILAAATFMACNQSQIKEVKEENSIYRSGKTFSYVERTVDSAMLFLEEVANYNSGNASHGFTDLIVDSVSYSLTISPDQLNGQTSITGSDQQWIKDTIVDRTGRYNSRVDTTSLTDFDIIFIDISDWSLSGSTLTFHGNIGIGAMDVGYIGEDCDGPDPYSSNDYWDWQDDNQGGCYPNNTTTSSSCQEMEKRLNYVKSAQCRLNPCINGFPYYKNITSDFTLPEEYPTPLSADPSNTSGDWEYDYLLWNVNTWESNRYCLTPEEMEFHTDGAEYIANDNLPSSGEVIAGYNLDAENFDEPGVGDFRQHWLTVYYGKIACY